MKKVFSSLGYAVLFAIEICVVSWVMYALFLVQPHTKPLWIPILIAFVFAFLLSIKRIRIGKKLCIGGGSVAIVCILVNLAIILAYLPNSDYVEVDDGKEALFADKRVMLVVPHQDDETNLAGGVIEEYIRYGSEVYVVYATNGDLVVPATQRLREGINALSVLGVDEEHIIFLGYGDAIRTDDGVPLYNAEGVAKSGAGYTSTYALKDHPPFREGRDYTPKNVVEDIRGVILQYRPDVIHAVDLDLHADHVLTALSFDRAMGEVLKETDYRPIVYKGYAYSTAYNSKDDSLALNILQTQDPKDEANLLAPGIHDWNGRVRMPVSAASLSRIVESSRLYKSALEHRSQDEADRMGKIQNGDKVFWQRETTSLCYNADIQVSSGDAKLLNDFVLADTSNAANLPESLCGVWHPEEDDTERSITITFDKPQNIRRIKLYDDPSPSDNILAATLIIDGEREIDIGALKPLGAETEIEVIADDVSSVVLKIIEYEGTTPGLTEFEVYGEEYEADASFIKLMNGAEDFVYDYYIDPAGEESFELYTYGCSTVLDECEVRCDGSDGCDAYVKNGKLVAVCPIGESCTVTISDGVNSDTVLLRNKGNSDIPYAMKLNYVEWNSIRTIRRDINYDLYCAGKFLEYAWHKVFG